MLIKVTQVQDKYNNSSVKIFRQHFNPPEPPIKKTKVRAFVLVNACKQNKTALLMKKKLFNYIPFISYTPGMHCLQQARIEIVELG